MLGALLVSAAMVWMSDEDTAPLASTGLAAAGAALVVAVVFVQSEGELVQTSLTAMLAGAVGVGGAAMLRWRRWAGVGAVLAVAGVLAALLAAGTRFARLAASGDAGIEPDLWVLVGVGILIATGVMALRSTPSAAVADVVRVVFTVALVLFAAAELLLLGGEGDDWRTVLTMSALTAAGVIGWLWRARLGVSFAPTAAVLAGLFGILALTLFAVRPFELVTVPPALGMIFIGARALRKTSALRTWPTLGPGLALLTIPSLLYDFGTTSAVAGGRARGHRESGWSWSEPSGGSRPLSSWAQRSCSCMRSTSSGHGSRPCTGSCHGGCGWESAARS